jgi:O-antigen ligase
VFLFHASTSGGSSASIGGNSRAIGLSNQPNLAGIAFSLGMIFAIGLLLELGFRRHWYLGVCVALLASALFLSGSVSGMACTIAGILVLFIARGVPLKTVLMVVLSFAVVYVLVFGVIDRGSKLDPVTRIEKATNSSGGSGSGTFELRVHTWGAAWREIQQSPVIGHGLDQETLALYYDQSLYVYYAPHNLILLYWYGGGIFLLVAMFIMMGSSFSRLLTGWRAQRRAGTRDPLRDVVLAACVADLVFCMQSPELVDRWLWIPFLLALCFRDSMNPPASARVTIARPEPLPVPPAPLAPAGNGAPSGNGQSRRVSGTVGRHAASAPVGGSEPGSSTGLPGPGAGVARHASTPPSSR